MANGRDWGPDDLFRDKSGKMRARILCWDGGEVHMERWNVDGRSRKRFSLPERFFLSDRCGWQLIRKGTLSDIMHDCRRDRGVSEGGRR